MHGVKRQSKSAVSADARAARKAKEAAKLQAYLAVEKEVFALRRAFQVQQQQHSPSQSTIDPQDALERTTQLLALNPELYTIWNFRREILLSIFPSPVASTNAEQKQPDVFAALREPSSSTSQNQHHEHADTSDNHAHKSETERLDRNVTLLEMDLELTEHALRAHPKVYWIWNHRMWCLIQYPTSASGKYGLRLPEWPWQRELKLVERMLDLDPRNFMGWNCRRAIISQLARVVQSPGSVSDEPQPAPSALISTAFPASLSLGSRRDDTEVHNKLMQLANTELAYSLRKIETNFSNFSAWHQRSKVLPEVWAALHLDETEKHALIDSELDLVKQAMFTDPADQSVWLYHRWLIITLFPHPTEQQSQSQFQKKVDVLTTEIDAIHQLFDLEPESKWCALSLAHYKALLASYVSSNDQRQKLFQEAKTLVQQLTELDPDRQGRYRDLLSGTAHF
ncbi:protein prenylyltransferase [Testicularia cyperi]|uniref:Geranylgeranyl transferase type-2 subunit alpha n=1 Tax=Testicularia cyperi TaxID=1882483 RepID=A0A317XPP1_9BASI|nr:protein prenylyltransferase [Testicularia cyperi]